jgi:hypothetical protein
MTKLIGAFRNFQTRQRKTALFGAEFYGNEFALVL